MQPVRALQSTGKSKACFTWHYAFVKNSFPIVIDSFRAEDLSTGKENTVLEISKSIDKQVILTTTLKHEEIGKYDDLPDVNHINYQSHTPSKILDGAFVESFVALLNDLSIEI